MITAKNYAAQAERGLLEYSKRLRRSGCEDDAIRVSSLSKDISNAVKFTLPINGIILEDSWKACESLDTLRLPYRSMTLEFDADGTSEGSENMRPDEMIVTKWVVFLTEVKDKIVFVFCPRTNGGWKVASIAGAFDINKDERPLIEGDTFWISQIPFIREISTYSKDIDNSNRILTGIGSIVLGFLGVLSCKNVEQSIHQKASPKNAQRVKSHKLPLYETKILTLKPTVAQVSGMVSGLGSHASKRQHLRRGHIRRLESGNIWVNSCVVGDASKGVINKQYKMAV